MKVLHVLHTSAPFVAGYCTRSSEILTQQRKLNIDVQVVTSAQHPSDGEVALETINGIEHWRTPTQPHRPPLVREWYLMRALEKRILEAIKVFQPDVIHAHSPVLVGYPAVRAARKNNLPLVYEIRDLWENALVDRNRFGASSPLYLLARQFETHLIRRADHVVTISEQLRNEVGSRAKHDRISVVGNGVNVEDFRHMPSSALRRTEFELDDKTLFGYIGTFQPYEGLFDLVDAFSQLAEQQLDIGLVIVGGGGIEEKLKDHVASKSCRNRVIMTGKVPRADVHLYYDLIDIFVYPRHDTATTRLTTPLKPLEAMAAMKPVIASRLPAMKELVRDGETGITCSPGDPKSLAICMNSVLKSGKQRLELVQQAYQWINDNRTWKAACAKYVTIYQNAKARNG